MDGDIKTYVKDLQGNEYPLQATITNENEVNGNQSLETTIYATEMNKKFIANIQEMWRIVDHDDVEHKIIYAKRRGIGQYKPEFIESGDSDSAFFYRPTQMVQGGSNENKLADSTQLSVEIKAEPLFFNELNNNRIYENINRSMTAMDAFTQIFANTSFDFTLSDTFSSSSWEGFGKGETKLETFKRALDHYKAEFRIAGNMIYLEKQIGRDTQFQYRHRLNSSNIEQEIDAEEMWTYGKGYADYGSGGDDGETETDTEDWENANITAEYKSPLADVLGKLHAPPVKDGRIKSEARLKEKIKQVIDESLKISVTADVYDLTEQGYPVAQSEVGDRVFLIDERIGLDDEVRVISQTKKRDWKGRIVDLSVTFGDEKVTKRHQAQLSTAAKDINDLLEGKKELPFSIFPVAEQNAMRALQKARTELIFGESKNGVQGIIAQEKDDPNRMVWLNSAGWMISTDGGATSKVAATADGLVAENIVGKSIIGLNLTSPSEEGYFHVNGHEAEFVDTDRNLRVQISPEGLYGYNSNDDINFQADSDLITSQAMGTSHTNIYLGSDDSEEEGEVRAVKGSTLGGTGNHEDYDYINIRARGIRGKRNNHFYYGSSKEHRFMSLGLSKGDYRNVRANRYFGNSVEVNDGSILYLRSDNRVRVMNKGDSNKYSDLQVREIKAKNITLSSDVTSASNFYIGVSGGELRVTNNSMANGSYHPVRASSFKEASSREYKNNIKELNYKASDVIKNLKVVEYDLKEDTIIEGSTFRSAPKKRVGFVAEDNDAISDDDNKAVDLGKTIGLNTKSIQELIERIEELEEQVNG